MKTPSKTGFFWCPDSGSPLQLDMGYSNQDLPLWSPSTPSNTSEVRVFPWQHALRWDSHVILEERLMDLLCPSPSTCPSREGTGVHNRWRDKHLLDALVNGSTVAMNLAAKKVLNEENLYVPFWRIGSQISKRRTTMEFFTAVSKSPHVIRPLPVSQESALLIYPVSTLLHYSWEFFEGQAQHHIDYSYQQPGIIMILFYYTVSLKLYITARCQEIHSNKQAEKIKKPL